MDKLLAGLTGQWLGIGATWLAAALFNPALNSNTVWFWAAVVGWMGWDMSVIRYNQER